MIPPSKLPFTGDFTLPCLMIYQNTRGYRLGSSLNSQLPSPSGLKDKILQSIHEVSVEHAVCEQDLSLVCMPVAFIIHLSSCSKITIVLQQVYLHFFWLHSLHYIALHHITLQYIAMHTCNPHHCTNYIRTIPYVQIHT